MRELQEISSVKEPSVREISPESDQEMSLRIGGFTKRLSSIFDQDINTSEIENAKLVINMA